MSEREKKEGGAGCFVMGVIGFFVPVLYVLGIGPVALISVIYPSTEKTLGAVYSPVLILCEKLRPVGELVDWYIKLWIG